MTEVATWIDADGAATILDPEWDVSGRGLPPSRLDEFTVPGQPGSVLRKVTDGPRDEQWVVWLTAGTESELWTKRRNLLYAMDPERGPGTLRVQTAVGDTREIVCTVVDGLAVVEKLGDTSGPEGQQLTLTFRAHRPYWKDTSPQAAGPWGPDPDASAFFPIFPLNLIASEVFRQVTVDNGGEVPAWPIWTVHGPGADIGVKNLTTGKQLLMPGSSLGAGEVLTIDTRPGKKTLLNAAGDSYWTYVQGVNALWSLAKGSNDIQLEMSDAVLGVSEVSMQYHREYKQL
jgi:hypothetical protein